MSRWRERKTRFEREEQERRQWCERARRGSVAEMSDFFGCAHWLGGGNGVVDARAEVGTKRRRWCVCAG